MVCLEEKNLLLEEFSGRVRRHFPETVWRSLYQDGTGKAQFGSATRTIICVECPAEGPLRRDGVLSSLGRVASRHGGLLDPCAQEFAVVSFHDPEAALRTAVEMQRLVPRARLRMALASGRFRMALCSAGDSNFVVLLGKERARVEDLARRAAPATVQLAPEAYQALEEVISNDLGSCLVLAEFDDDVLTEVSLTLPPDAAAELSTFAGLGLT